MSNTATFDFLPYKAELFALSILYGFIYVMLWKLTGQQYVSIGISLATVIPISVIRETIREKKNIGKYSN